MEIFEGPTKEFIGLLCYHSAFSFGRNEIPLGVVEKSLSIGKHLLNLNLPDYKGVLWIRGSQGLLNFPSSLAYLLPEFTRDLKSGYFNKDIRGNHTFFQHNEMIVQQFDRIVWKPYYGHFDGAVRALLEIWLNSGLRSLMAIDMNRFGDGGLRFLAADLEIALIEIKKVIENEEVDPKNKSRFENALDGMRDKIKIIKEAQEILKDASLKCKHPLALELIRGTILMNPKSSLLDLS